MTAGSLTAADLAELQSLDSLFMPDSCQIVHITPGTPIPGGDGTNTTGDVTTTTAYACRCSVSGGSPQETLIASRLTDTASFTFSLPHDAVIDERDTITYQGGVYEVVGVLNPTSYQTSVRVVTARVR